MISTSEIVGAAASASPAGLPATCHHPNGATYEPKLCVQARRQAPTGKAHRFWANPFLMGRYSLNETWKCAL